MNISMAKLKWQGSTSGYIDWIVNDTVAWGLKGAGLGSDSATEIGPRPIPSEPMVRLPCRHHKGGTNVCNSWRSISS